MLSHLVEKVDHLIIGGGMANTFLAAQKVNVGVSLCEHDLIEKASTILAKALSNNCLIYLPTDVIVAKEFKENAQSRTTNTNDVQYDEMILDVGPDTVKTVCKGLEACKTLIWNGPLGAFEISPFDTATVAVALKAGELTQSAGLISVAGGGDTIAALINTLANKKAGLFPARLLNLIVLDYHFTIFFHIRYHFVRIFRIIAVARSS